MPLPGCSAGAPAASHRVHSRAHQWANWCLCIVQEGAKNTYSCQAFVGGLKIRGGLWVQYEISTDSNTTHNMLKYSAGDGGKKFFFAFQQHVLLSAVVRLHWLTDTFLMLLYTFTCKGKQMTTMTTSTTTTTTTRCVDLFSSTAVELIMSLFALACTFLISLATSVQPPASMLDGCYFGQQRSDKLSKVKRSLWNTSFMHAKGRWLCTCFCFEPFRRPHLGPIWLNRTQFWLLSVG